MKALLRLQAVLLLRNAASTQGVVVGGSLATGIGSMWWVDRTLGSLGVPPFFGLSQYMTLLVGALVGLACMVMTLDGMDVVRWTEPVRASQALRAHMTFWTVICAIPASVMTCLYSDEGHSAVPYFCSLVLFGSFTAAVALVFQRQLRRRSVGGVLLAFVLVGGTAGTAVSGVAMACVGDGLAGMLLVGIVFCIAMAAGAWSFLHDEGLPVIVGKPERPTLPPDPGTRTAGRTRTPAISVLRGSWPPVWTGLWVAMGLVYQAMPWVPDWLPLIWIPITVLNLVNIVMSSWKWLLATPLDRNRAFRTLFLPLVAFAGLMATTRYMAVEFAPDRSVLLHDFRVDRRFGKERGLLVQGDLLREDPTTRTYCAPEPPLMAARVREHVRRRFGLDVPEDRILGDILRGWPELKPGWSTVHQDAILDAMARIQVDLGPELKSAERLRRAAGVLLAFLITMLALRVQLEGIRRSRILMPVIVLPVLCIALLPEFLLRIGAPGFLLAPGRSFLSAFQDTHSPVPLVLVVAAGGAAYLLWRSSVAAFRRLDITDLPPPIAMRGLWGQRE